MVEQMRQPGTTVRDDEKTDLLTWLGLRSAPALSVARLLGPVISIAVLLLIFLSVTAAFVVLMRAVFFGLPTSAGGGLGTGAVAVAIIGAPLVIWRSMVAQKSVEVQEQGQITDRINTAVQGLGAQKEVNRIGRPVTIWTGATEDTVHQVSRLSDWAPPPRTIELMRYYNTSINSETGDEFSGLHIHTRTWADARTVIEWQSEKEVEERPGEHRSEEGKWEVFTSTEPNLEVRIGAIYALERIAKDSDRDHVQIMEILCAYIRENAPAKEAEPWPKLEIRLVEIEGPLEEDWNERLEEFLEEQSARIDQLSCQTDIQAALTVIGRIKEKQLRLEAKKNPIEDNAEFVFDWKFPSSDDFFEIHEHDPKKLKIYKKEIVKRQITFRDYEGYRLDLRDTNLRGADLSKLSFHGALFEGSALQGAVLIDAGLRGTDFRSAQMQGANLSGAQLQCANLGGALLQGAHLDEASMQGANIGDAKMHGAQLGLTQMQHAGLKAAHMHGAFAWARLQGADIRNARLQGADFGHAWMQGANLGSARVDAQTQLNASSLSGAAFRRIDLTNQLLLQEDVASAFGDGSVSLVSGRSELIWPAHWPEIKLEGMDEVDGKYVDRFEAEWRKWQADPENYEPPTE